MENEEKVEWDSALSNLNWQAKNGSTGTQLIIAAEDAFSRYERRITDINGEIDEIHRDYQAKIDSLVSQNEKIENRLMDVEAKKNQKIKELEDQVTQITTLRVKPQVTDEDVSFEFSPRTTRLDYNHSTFSLEHLEEILMYLRLNGADNETAVKVDDYGISCVVSNGGYIIPKNEKSDPTPKKKDTLGKRALQFSFRHLVKPLLVLGGASGLVTVGLKIFGG